MVLKLKKIQDRFQQQHKADLFFDEQVVQAVADRCRMSESGARVIDSFLSNTLLPELSEEILIRMADEKPFSQARVEKSPEGYFDYIFDDEKKETPNAEEAETT